MSAPDESHTAQEPETEPEILEAIAGDAHAEQRFDRVLATLFPAYSRAWLTRAIKQGDATLNGRAVRPRALVSPGDAIRLVAHHRRVASWTGQAIPLQLVHEDDDVLVVDKPAGLVVHPGAGNHDQTLANALLHHCPTLDTIPRAGVVHRLDKDTSGLLVVAKTLRAHTALVAALAERDVSRTYVAIVAGEPTAGGTIDAPIGRSRTHRTRMAVLTGGRPARTHYRVVERFATHAYLRVNLESGRTHQIRVHLTHIGFPIVGDPVYRGRTQTPRGTPPPVREQIAALSRQALHAEQLAFAHPGSGETLHFESSLPDDMGRLLNTLREGRT
ncbi:MAG: 23S rRNA pseudouridine(1911/1915/1917) synthase RluD [Pseudomonadota bacterium]